MLSAIVLPAWFAPLTSIAWPVTTAENIEAIAATPTVAALRAPCKAVLEASSRWSLSASSANSLASFTGLMSTRVAPNA